MIGVFAVIAAATWLALGAVGVAMFQFDQDRELQNRAVQWHLRGLWRGSWTAVICGPIVILVSAFMSDRPYGLKWTLSERACADAYVTAWPILAERRCMREFGFSDAVITETLVSHAPVLARTSLDGL